VIRHPTRRRLRGNRCNEPREPPERRPRMGLEPPDHHQRPSTVAKTARRLGGRRRPPVVARGVTWLTPSGESPRLTRIDEGDGGVVTMQGMENDATTDLQAPVEHGVKHWQAPEARYDVHRPWCISLRPFCAPICRPNGHHRSGIVRTKQWLTADDENADSECTLNEEQGPIPLESLFAWGRYAQTTDPRCILQLVVYAPVHGGESGSYTSRAPSWVALPNPAQQAVQRVYLWLSG